jgi:hypothetical protein
MKRDEMWEFAVAGIDAAIEKAKAELDQLLKQRKALGGKMAGSSKRLVEAVTEAASAVAPARKRRKRTAAERKAVSLRMKAYWAGRREAKGKKKGAAKSADK